MARRSVANESISHRIKTSSLRLFLCFCIGITCIADCTGSLQRTCKPLRTVHVKVVADPGFSSTPQWQGIVTALFEKTSLCMEKCAGVALKVDSMTVWDIETAPSHNDLPVGDCLVKEQPRGKSDIVVYFARMGNPPALISGMTLYELGYAFIQQPTTTDPTRIDEKSVYSLIHWLGHIFGAAHCYYNSEKVTVMNPFVHEGVIMESKNSKDPAVPEFHKGNMLLMKGLSWRPFEEKAWANKDWPKIKKLYDGVRNAYNPWKITREGELSNYENDAFHEGNLLLYLSSWASLCGHPEAANRYLDSLLVLYSAITGECVREGVVGKTRICAQCGYDAREASNWLSQQKFHIGMRRALIQIRKGDTAAADSCFTSAMNMLPDQLAVMKDKFTNEYSWFRERSLASKSSGTLR